MRSEGSISYVKIVDLLTEDEWREVCESLGLAALAKSVFKATPEEVFRSVSKTTYAMAVLGKVSPLVTMLKDIINVLQRYGVHARTTNSIVVLAGQFQLTQQQFDLAIKWSDDIVRVVEGKTWSELETEL